jgi:hypothetical protein
MVTLLSSSLPPIVIWSHLWGLLLSLKSLRNAFDKVASSSSFSKEAWLCGICNWEINQGQGCELPYMGLGQGLPWINGNSSSPLGSPVTLPTTLCCTAGPAITGLPAPKTLIKAGFQLWALVLMDLGCPISCVIPNAPPMYFPCL